MNTKINTNCHTVLLLDKSLTLSTFILKKIPIIKQMIQDCNDCNNEVIPINCTSKFFCKLLDYIEYGIPIKHKYLPICRYLGIIPVQTLLIPVPNDSMLSINNYIDIIIDIINLKANSEESKESEERIAELIYDIIKKLIHFFVYIDDIYELLFSRIKNNTLSDLFIDMMINRTIHNDAEPNFETLMFRRQDLIRNTTEKKYWTKNTHNGIKSYCEVAFNFTESCILLSQEGKLYMSCNYLEEPKYIILSNIRCNIYTSVEKFISSVRSNKHFQVIKELRC